MKRGTENKKDFYNNHPMNTLYAKPENIAICHVGIEQIFIKGKILKRMEFENHEYADGKIAVELHQRYKCQFMPDVYALFNYLEPGRYEDNKL